MPRVLTRCEYDSLMTYLQPKTKSIWVHENENRLKNNQPALDVYQARFSLLNCYPHNVGDGNWFVVDANSGFLQVVRADLCRAAESFPKKFGTGNADDVLDALYSVSVFAQFGKSREEYIQHIIDTYYCYVVYNCDGRWGDIMRVDLFRLLKHDKDGRSFLGGLLHTLKHFNVDGEYLSTGKENLESFDVEHVVYLIAMAFRLKTKDVLKANDYVAIQALTKDVYMKAVFYLDKYTGVYYLNTYHKDRRLKG